jgi:hypothetical protein
MRRIDLINAVVKVQQAFIESKIQSFLFMSTRREHAPEEVISAFQTYSRFYDSFGATEKRVLEIFGLRGLEAPKTLAMILSSDKIDNNESLRLLFRGVAYFVEFFPNVVALLKQDNVSYEKETSKMSGVILPDESRGMLTVILPENHREISSPERLIKAMESIQLFYKVIAQMEDLNANELSVAAIDSGSDKSFDFLGAAQVMTSLKELVIELWDRIVFYRERKLHEKLELVAKSLPILERINAMEQESKMGKEQCEILRREIIDGAKKFISSGAVIPEFSDENYHNPRELMAPEAKLLVESNSNLTEKASALENAQLFDDSELDDGLSEDERETLKALNAKKKKGK